MLSVKATNVTSSTNPPKTFDKVFDMRFLDQVIEPIPSTRWATFINALPPCNTTKIDFSFTLPLGAPAADYSGSITLLFEPVIDYCQTPTPISDPAKLSY